MPGPVSTWMGDRLWADKPSRYVSATKVGWAFYGLLAAYIGGSEAQAGWFGLKVGSHLVPFLYSSCESSELSQWLCLDDSTINIVVIIIIIPFQVDELVLMVYQLIVWYCIVTVMCYKPRPGASGDGCNAKDGNPFGPFWDTFNVDFDRSEYYGPLGFNTEHKFVAWQWHERLAL